MSNWGNYFLDIAKIVASKSKDPSTKVGAVIVRPDNTICSTGYNGFPRGMNDSPKLYDDREYKYANTIHGEINAILFAGEPLYGYTLYTYPFMPCRSCALIVAQSGIKKVIAPKCPPDKSERWEASFERTRAIFKELNVEVVEKDYV